MALLCILAAAGVAAAIVWRPHPPPVLASRTILAPARPLADFSLIDNRGRSFGPEDHSAAIFVIDPAGRLAALLTGPFTVDALQSDLQRIATAGA